MGALLNFLAERARIAPSEAQYRAESIQSRLNILTRHVSGVMMGVHADWEELRNAQPHGFKSATARALAISIAHHCFPNETFAILRYFNLKAHELREAQEFVEFWSSMNYANKSIHINALASAQHILGVAVEWSKPCDVS